MTKFYLGLKLVCVRTLLVHQFEYSDLNDFESLCHKIVDSWSKFYGLVFKRVLGQDLRRLATFC